MSQGRSTKDLVKLALYHSGELQDGTSDYHEAALTYVNYTHKSILSGSNIWKMDIGERWSWARERDAKSLILQPSFTDGTVDITNGSDIATINPAPAISLQGRYLKITERNDPTYYKILSHIAASSSLTLDSIVVEEDGSSLAYAAIPLVYDLGSDILRLVEPMRVYASYNDNHYDDDAVHTGKISSMDLNSMRAAFPLKYLKDGIPSKFAILHHSDDEYLVQFSSNPKQQVKVDFDWIKIPVPLVDADDSYPLIPFNFREVLAYGAAYFILRDKNDDQRGEMFQLAQAQLVSLKKAEMRENDMTDTKYGRPIPRGGQLGRYHRRRLYY